MLLSRGLAKERVPGQVLEPAMRSNVFNSILEATQSICDGVCKKAFNEITYILIFGTLLRERRGLEAETFEAGCRKSVLVVVGQARIK